MDKISLPDGVSLLDLISLPGLPLAILVLFGTWLIARLGRGFLSQLGERYRDRRLLLMQVATLASFGVYLVGVGLASALALNLTQNVVIALTGTLAVAVGFALKDLLASVIAGIIILIDPPFRVGDRVTFAGNYGEITAIGLRAVRLTTLDDNVVTIPNNKFLTEVVSSGNLGALDMLVQVDFFVTADEDPRRAMAVVEDCVVTGRYVFLGKPWVVLVNQVIEGNYLAWRLRTKAYVFDVKYEKAYETDLTLRIAEAFRQHGIGAPGVRVQGAALG